MKITAVVPVFNCEKYIAECIESILAQDRAADEVIVVNDGSTDGTLEVLQKYAAKITIISRENRGVSATQNQGIRAASGDVIALLDADDLWATEKLAKQIPLLVDDPKLDAVFANLQQFISPDLPMDVQKRFVLPQNAQVGFVKGTMLVRKSAFERLGYFDETLKILDYVEWFSRVSLLNFTYTVLPDVLTFRRLSPGSLSQSKGYNAEALLIMKRRLDAMKAQPTQETKGNAVKL